MNPKHCCIGNSLNLTLPFRTKRILFKPSANRVRLISYQIVTVSSAKNNQSSRISANANFFPELKHEKLIPSVGSRQSSGFHGNQAFDLSCTLRQTRTHTHSHMHTHTHIHSHIHTHTQIHKHLRLFTHTHANTYTLTRVQTHTELSSRSVLQINLFKLSKRYKKSQFIFQSRKRHKAIK